MWGACSQGLKVDLRERERERKRERERGGEREKEMVTNKEHGESTVYVCQYENVDCGVGGVSVWEGVVGIAFVYLQSRNTLAQQKKAKP